MLIMDKISSQYNQAAQLIKSAILQNQLEAARAVNRQMLALYYGVGKCVSDNTRKGVWGTGAIETISEQLRRELQCLGVFELKKGAFKPAYLGQLSAYIRMLNDDERKPHENPTIGIVLCLDANKTYVEYLLQDYTQPMGVATYKVMPEKLKKILPPEEDFKRLLDGEEIADDDK